MPMWTDFGEQVKWTLKHAIIVAWAGSIGVLRRRQSYVDERIGSKDSGVGGR